MNRTNKEIKDRFVFFDDLVNKNKTVLNNTIQLAPKESNARWLVGQSNVQHVSIPEDILLVVEKSKIQSKYGIKLRCTSLTKDPFFRFDSDGPSHRNNFPDIPLEEQSISTPHFNTYKENGKPFAYKNDTLKKNSEAAAIANDVDFGLSLFCDETKSKLSSGGVPTISYHPPELELTHFENINFDQIDFE